jgi:phage terminase large subunit-like protein
LRWALEQPDLLQPIMADASWLGWRTLLIAAMGEELTPEERTVFQGLTGRERESGAPVEEAFFIVGRGGKTRAAAVLACHLAVFGGLNARLVAGERGVVAVLAASVWQAQRAFGYIKGVLDGVAAFRELVVASSSDEIVLSNGISIECRPASYRTLRGASLVAVIADELAYWRFEQDSRNPDREILDAVRPALAASGGPLIVISSPYAKAGELWGTFRRHFGEGGDPLVRVARAATRTMNPALSEGGRRARLRARPCRRERRVWR